MCGRGVALLGTCSLQPDRVGRCSLARLCLAAESSAPSFHPSSLDDLSRCQQEAGTAEPGGAAASPAHLHIKRLRSARGGPAVSEAVEQEV